MVCGKGPSIGGKVKKEAKRFGNKLKKGVRKIGDMLTPDMPEIIIEGDQAAEAGPQYVMPDEEEIRRARRRRGASSRSGRSATIMSGDSTDTLGG